MLESPSVGVIPTVFKSISPCLVSHFTRYNYNQLTANKNESSYLLGINSNSNDPSHQHQQRSLNIGTAIRVISEDYPGFVENSHQLNFSIYRDNLLFEDKTHSLSLQGLTKYQMLLRFGQRIMHALFRETRLEITGMSLINNDNTLAVQWRFTGTRRFGLGWIASPSRSNEGKIKRVEGYSYYEFDDDGRIKEHTLDQIEPPLQRWTTLKAWFWWIGRIPDPSFQHHYQRNTPQNIKIVNKP